MPTSRIILDGRVQGVGFRPFVYRLACEHRLSGWVRNRTGQVEILAQGEAADLAAFTAALIEQAPPLARPNLLDQGAAAAEPLEGFAILESEAGARPEVHVPPDQFACDACLAEMRTPADRRHRYPFTNCTQCGPRYTLIARLPYDRPNTSMAGFPLCPACRSEYEAPADRRFHAEPVACPACGPQLSFIDKAGREVGGDEPALAASLAALAAGEVVAVKGVGGYHLMCDARSTAAVERLRTRKHRPDKPLAVMFPARGADGLETVRAELEPDKAEAALLAGPERPIVLCRQRPDSTLAAAIAPGLDEVGAMLPYSPLHHLLLDDFGGPLVATSGNLSGEPVLTDNAEARRRLAAVADAFVEHNRPILRPADDPVFRSLGGRPRPLRLGRGIAPLELALAAPLEAPLLAVGGQMKNSIALAWDTRLVVSPHIGELDSPRALAVFEQVIADLQRLYGIEARRVVCDAHPGYASSRWARHSGLALSEVFHHHAHASALYGEHCGEGDWLALTWDGTGYGEDGSLWGGEALWGRPGSWRRVGSLRPFRLPGGEKTGREPWRSAAALCWESGHPWTPPVDSELLHAAWARGLNSPPSSAAGRLFDAAAALLGLCERASFEGQGPMRLEAVADSGGEALPLPLEEADGVLRIDWAPLLPLLTEAGRPVAERAGVFHASLARAAVEQVRALRERHPFDSVALSGGVFQNRQLSALVQEGLEAAGFRVRLAEQVPCNDGGLCYGQVIEALNIKY